ncbi:phytochelatin synthase family protein [Dongia sedimenti]|uniref:glutathione gamma-glutamylcysteinyltransferase n=1 Tax=Dongia sedimenti TaxID=3064282 RepID=A0ABU0YP33_9PROT|nr:phytochelatin synthase family protein [Rhodospirillaceae bacterium R-7]
MNELSRTTASHLSPLSRDHAYIQNNPAPAYWALSPHLIHQHTDCSCSLATATMLLNGARAMDGVSEIGQFVSERGLLERMADPEWEKGITPPDGGGASLAELRDKLARALSLYALSGWSVEHCIVAAEDSATGAAFRAHLIAMEQKGDRLLAGNYHLATTYGDSWDIGHFSPLGAYDAATDRVLLLDVWKADYEPCWVDRMRLLKAMVPVSPVSGTPRGYLVLKRG